MILAVMDQENEQGTEQKLRQATMQVNKITIKSVL